MVKISSETSGFQERACDCRDDEDDRDKDSIEELGLPYDDRCELVVVRGLWVFSNVAVI